MPPSVTPAETALRESLAMLRLTVDSAPGWLALVAPDGTYLVANRKYADAFGKPISEVEGRCCWDVYPELVSVHKPLFERAVAGETVTVDDVLPLDPEHPTYVHGCYRPVFDSDGSVRCVSVIVVDDTDRVVALDALRRSEERFRQVFAALPVAVEVRDGHDFGVEYLNSAYEALTGRTREQVPRDPALFLQAVHPDDRDRMAGAIARRAGNPSEVDEEFRLLRPDGSPRWIWARSIPVLDEQGGVRWWVSSMADITRRKEAEEALRTSEERLAVTLASIGEGVIAVDTAGHVVLLNEVAERLTGWPANEALGRPLDEVFHLSERGWRTRAEDGYGLHGRRVLSARDGRAIPVESRVTPLLDPGGNVLGEVLVVRDISEVLRREEERIQTQKLESLAVLAGGIAHDFNNLLTGIQGNLSLAIEAGGLPEDVAGWLQDAVAASERSQGLTQQLLTFARGGAPVRKVSDLRQAIRQAASFASLGSAVACRVEVAADLWPVDADVGQVTQVIQNLVLNAIEATPGSGEVRVECSNRTLGEGNPARLPPGPYLCLQVVDHGSGIPEEIRARIFDPYFSTKKRRSGLGLAISHSVVARHGGRIGVQSVPGQGTTFEVWLPALPQAGPTAAGSPRPAPICDGSVLVMDDDPFVRRVVQRALAHLGYSVVTAADGREAVDAYENALREGTPFDLVLMDLTVPGGLGGVEAMAALRGVDPGVCAIVMSGYSDNPAMSDPGRYGFAAVLPKPFTIERLQEALIAARASMERPGGPG